MTLHKSDLHPRPIQQLKAWLADAQAAGIQEPKAMTLATATPDGIPSARMVLLRGLDERGLVFYTHYDSPKAHDLTANPRAAVVFYWAALGRQVRVTGTISRVAHAESEAYFASRPVGHRLSAWASPQSQPIPDRAYLEDRLAEVTERFADGDVPLPPYWGGFRLTPDTFEFWQSGENRLHDRFRYIQVEGAAWLIERLAP